MLRPYGFTEFVPRRVFEQHQQVVSESAPRKIAAEILTNYLCQTANLFDGKRREIVGMLSVVHADTISRNSVGGNWAKTIKVPH